MYVYVHMVDAMFWTGIGSAAGQEHAKVGLGATAAVAGAMSLRSLGRIFAADDSRQVGESQ